MVPAVQQLENTVAAQHFALMVVSNATVSAFQMLLEKIENFVHSVFGVKPPETTVKVGFVVEEMVVD